MLKGVGSFSIMSFSLPYQNPYHHTLESGATPFLPFSPLVPLWSQATSPLRCPTHGCWCRQSRRKTGRNSSGSPGRKKTKKVWYDWTELIYLTHGPWKLFPTTFGGDMFVVSRVYHSITFKKKNNCIPNRFEWHNIAYANMHKYQTWYHLPHPGPLHLYNLKLLWQLNHRLGREDHVHVLGGCKRITWYDVMRCDVIHFDLSDVTNILHLMEVELDNLNNTWWHDINHAMICSMKLQNDAWNAIIPWSWVKMK